MMMPPGNVVFVTSMLRTTKFLSGSMLVDATIFEKLTMIGSAWGIGDCGDPESPLSDVIESTAGGTGSGPNAMLVWNWTLNCGCVEKGGAGRGSAKMLGPTGGAELPPNRNP